MSSEWSDYNENRDKNLKAPSLGSIDVASLEDNVSDNSSQTDLSDLGEIAQSSKPTVIKKIVPKENSKAHSVPVLSTENGNSQPKNRTKAQPVAQSSSEIQNSKQILPDSQKNQPKIMKNEGSSATESENSESESENATTTEQTHQISSSIEFDLNKRLKSKLTQNKPSPNLETISSSNTSKSDDLNDDDLATDIENNLLTDPECSRDPEDKDDLPNSSDRDEVETRIENYHRLQTKVKKEMNKNEELFGHLDYSDLLNFKNLIRVQNHSDLHMNRNSLALIKFQKLKVKG